MEHPKSEFLTRTIRAIDSGDAQAASELVPFLYHELRDLAGALMKRRPPGQTLQPTALVHEAYLRLVGKDSGWAGRGHFFAAAAQAMREILIQEARRKAAQKRGGDRRRVELDSGAVAIEPPTDDVDILALDEALRRLEAEEPRTAKVVLLRYFAGLTIPETAEALGISTGTVEREWRFARATLYDQLGGESDNSERGD